MRVYYLSGSLLPSMEASGVNVMRMCDALARIGHDVTLFARRNGSDDAAAVLRRYAVSEKVRLVLLGESNPPHEHNPPTLRAGYEKNILYPLLVRRALLGMPAPDLIYGRHLYTSIMAALALPGVPFAFELHRVRGDRVGRLAERWLFKRCNFLGAAVISDALRADYRRLHSDLSCLHLFLARDAADEPRVELYPRNLGGRPAARRFGYAGSLYPGKGMETVAALAERLPDADFHVVGGSKSDLATWTSRTSHLSNVLYHGYVDNAHVPEYLAAMDVLLAPPREVTRSVTGRDIARWMSPLKIFEYMAAGKPIVASDLPVVREILQDGLTALLVPPDDIDAWLIALRRLEDSALASRLAASAQADLQERFTWTARARSIIANLRHRYHKDFDSAVV
jgi:glycosyltransferase involved in cell wall biosynthesis